MQKAQRHQRRERREQARRDMIERARAKPRQDRRGSGERCGLPGFGRVRGPLFLAVLLPIVIGLVNGIVLWRFRW
ncbi:hypothetical protein ACIQBJ_33805 [Kitasatospora sp. NPDC088391]|uniref:hypothetical protein n=1 Tax=Kitasatospora sp. NPDC088391 TaxID=3364074 RepID=UPI0037F91F6D